MRGNNIELRGGTHARFITVPRYFANRLIKYAGGLCERVCEIGTHMQRPAYIM